MSRAPLAVRAFVLGVATGGRSVAGIAALSRGRGTLGPLSATPARAAVTFAQLGEVVADKLPATPSRLALPALSVRVVAGKASGFLLARSEQRPYAVAAVLGAVGALAGSHAGARWRAVADQHLPDWAGAVVEDAVVVALAAYALEA